MHLWWPSGQAGGPWSEQGRQASPTSPTLTSVSRTGPNPNSGIVGPNTATTGVPIAVARCKGALSFVTSSRARAISTAH